MKQVSESVRRKLPTNCDGPEEWFSDQVWEITPEDVGRVKPHHLGHKHHTGYAFRRTDIGRFIIERSGRGGYTCWFFQTGVQT